MDAVTISTLNNVIVSAGKLRCLSSKEIQEHAKLSTDLTFDPATQKGTYWVGQAEGVVATVGLAVALTTPIGWLSLLAFGAAAFAANNSGSRAIEQVQVNRHNNQLRDLTEWEKQNYQPWLEAVIPAAHQLLGTRGFGFLHDVTLGVDTDSTLVDKVLGDWCIAVATDESQFSLEDLATMLTIRHIDLGLESDMDLMTSLFEAIGEADLLLTQAGVSTQPTLKNYAEWIVPKVALSGTPFLSPVTHNLAHLIASYYTQAVQSNNYADRLALLNFGYFCKLLQILSNKGS